MATEVFNRVEIKYILEKEDLEVLLPLLEKNMNCDAFNKGGKTYSIANLYFDTDSDELIRRSLEKPVYKEKLRLRSYGQSSLTDIVYLEIKKKFKGTVYKRRSPFILNEAYAFIENGILPTFKDTNFQVLHEIQNFMQRYNLKPKVFISYDRLAFFEKEDSDFRLTLDSNIQTRRKDLRLDSPLYGEELLKEGQYLMEAKAFKAFPLWFVRFLSSRKINQVSFSKYGNEYKRYSTSQKLSHEQEVNS